MARNVAFISILTAMFGFSAGAMDRRGSISSEAAPIGPIVQKVIEQMNAFTKQEKPSRLTPEIAKLSTEIVKGTDYLFEAIEELKAEKNSRQGTLYKNYRLMKDSCGEIKLDPADNLPTGAHKYPECVVALQALAPMLQEFTIPVNVARNLKSGNAGTLTKGTERRSRISDVFAPAAASPKIPPKSTTTPVEPK